MTSLYLFNKNFKEVQSLRMREIKCINLKITYDKK